MQNNDYELINQQKATLEEVLKNLEEQKLGTDWAKETNVWAADYAKKLGQTYGDNWYKGLLPKELLREILLPQHSHEHDFEGSGDKDPNIFPLDTPLAKAGQILKSHSYYYKNCLDLIEYLKEQIKKNSFNTSLVLAVIGGKLKHVDGLHRMIALSELIDDGYEYKPVPVYLCHNMQTN